MPIRQAFNPRIKAWVKYDFKKKRGFRVIDVKQKNPRIPFKNVKKAGNIYAKKKR